MDAPAPKAVFRLRDKEEITSMYRRHFKLFFELSVISLVTLEYALGHGLSHRFSGWFYLLPLVIGLIIFVPALNRYRMLSGTMDSVFSGHILMGIFILAFTPLFGPYYLLFFLFLYIAAYYHGRSGAVISFSFIGYLLTLAAVFRRFMPIPVVNTESIVVTIILIFLMSLFFEYMIWLDRSERHQVRTAVSDAALEHSRLQSIVGSIAEACIGVSKDGTILFYNQAAGELLPGRVDPLGTPLQASLPLRTATDQVIDLPRFLKRSAQSDEPEDLHFTSDDGQQTHLAVSVAPVVMDGAGRTKVHHYILVIRNISAEKELDEERDTFFAIASHELRAPLTGVRGSIQMLGEEVAPKISEEENYMLQTAEQQLAHLSEIIDDVLLLAEAQRKLLPIDLKMVEPSVVLDGLARNFTKAAEAKGLKLGVEVREGVHPVLSSQDTIVKILGLFVGNAIKFTEQGSVTLVAEPGDDKQLRFVVRDTGPGISKSDQHKLFKRFSQVEDYMTRRVGGTGLGLYTTTKLAARIKGKVWCESVVDKGSGFYLEVPPQSYLKDDQEKATQVELDQLVETL